MNPKRISIAVVAALAALGAACTQAESESAAPSVDFGAHWHDGKAELDGYRLTISRYNQTRDGHAVMIFVTEPFSESRRVKVDNPNANPDDTFEALKLNLVRDFQTGIYDYNTMVSVFSRSENFEPAKLTFSSAEWCGHVFEELVFGDGNVRGHYDSYFEGESGDVNLEWPDGGVAEDNLFILLRGLRGEYLAAGGSKTVPYLPGVLYTRFAHRPLKWTSATISRHASSETVTVPAGEFETMVYDVKVDGGRDGVFHIESAYPHRIVKWSLAPDVSGELTGSKRLAYWRLNGEGQESHLADIGLGHLVDG